MIYTIGATTLLIGAFLIYRTLRKTEDDYSSLTLADIGKHLGTALVPGIFGGMAVIFVMTRFFPVNEIGHPFAPYYGEDLIYKARVKTAKGQETIGEVYIYYDRNPAEDECGIEVDKLKFNGRTYSVDADEGYNCLYDFDRWSELALEGHGDVEVMLLDEKVGEW
jgi:hypothetical protein